MWKSDYSIEQVNSMNKNTILETLGIEITEAESEFGDSYRHYKQTTPGWFPRMGISNVSSTN